MRTGQTSAMASQVWIALLAILLLIICIAPAAAAPCDEAAKPLVAVLRKAYPQLQGTLMCQDSGVAFYQPSGEQAVSLPLISAPGVAEAPAASSLQSTLAQAYPLGAGHRYPAKGFDPGRVRSTPLLKYLYGANAEEVRASCDTINFFGTPLLFNRRHGAADALRRVVKQLEKHVAAHPHDTIYVLPSAGTFAWRPVKNTGLLSAHSFGIAIDLNADKGLYWLWKPSQQLLDSTRKHYPQAIVDAFEAEGFIWGGKWDAFDFMHFEYRPELIAIDTAK